MRKALLLAGVCAAVSVVVSACMTRPVTSTEPHTSNLDVEPIHNEVIDKIDLVFMIDNSQSMGDKQKLLAKAVPQLLQRLVVPRCVSVSGAIHERASLNEACPADSAPEFGAVKDIHVAVVTSSLGAHGAQDSSCTGDPPFDDRALLLPKVRPDSKLGSYSNSGFLAWDPDQKLKPPGESDPQRLGQQFGDMVAAAGEAGCGYEASLESWYRFLIDPEPPRAVVVENQQSVVHDVDRDVLAQREAFLRPDSLVAIVMLTDENDCSIRDDGSGYLLANGSDSARRDRARMVRSNSACAKDPNDACCAPCVTGALQGCPSLVDDPECQKGNYLDAPADPTNLRCMQNKRRFGYDFLYPTSRYIDGLTQPVVLQRSTGTMVENPLFKKVPGFARRPKGLVYLAGIVGVPWQDVADDDSQHGAGLRYLTAGELTAKKRWDVIAGDANKDLAPQDPFMVESTAPRSGQNPITGDAIVPATSTNPQANAINGHEQAEGDGTDLQYACTFRLADAAPCSGDNCDCQDDPTLVTRNRPLCQPPAGGAPEATQFFGKAYPGLRHLEVLKGIGDAAIVASICPKVLNEGEPGYGYEPAVDAIVDRLRVALNGRCLPRPLTANAGGKLPCTVVEALDPPAAGASCSCDANRRTPATPEAVELVQQQLQALGQCGTAETPSCSSFCFCELPQATGAGLDQCLNNEAGSDEPGYCYIDPFGTNPQGNPALVAGCGATNKRLIRFVGPDTPKPGATTFAACLGATLN